MQYLLNRLGRSPVSRTAAASCLAFLSNAIWGLVSIPIAVAFLKPVELGLWTVLNVLLSYLVYFDFGVGQATGRLMADSVARRDQDEINRWWTATRAALCTLAFILVTLSLVFHNLILTLIDVPETLRPDAKWLLIGGLVITGLSIPMRGAPGLLTSQNRFYWVPLVQATTPWINLIVFYLLLRQGYGVKSYIWAMGASQIAMWICFTTLIITGPDRPRFVFSRLELNRFKKLFKVSLSMSLSGLSDTALQSLPAIIIARFGLLSTVPIYNFTWKGPQLTSSLVQRAHHSFYPGLQMDFVSNRIEVFRRRFQCIGFLTLGIALTAAGMVLGFNGIIVQVLAGKMFYAGPAVNAAFALAIVTIPISELFKILLVISGHLGKLALISIIQLSFFIITSFILWPLTGIPGIAFSFALTPLFIGAYGYFRGKQGCGFGAPSTFRSVALAAIASMFLVISCGTITSFMSWHSAHVLSLSGRQIELPPLTTIIIALIPSLAGGVLAGHSIRTLFLSSKLSWKKSS